MDDFMVKRVGSTTSSSSSSSSAATTIKTEQQQQQVSDFDNELHDLGVNAVAALDLERRVIDNVCASSMLVSEYILIRRWCTLAA
jgi:hypothetical protein